MDFWGCLLQLWGCDMVGKPGNSLWLHSVNPEGYAPGGCNYWNPMLSAAAAAAAADAAVVVAAAALRN